MNESTIEEQWAADAAAPVSGHPYLWRVVDSVPSEWYVTGTPDIMRVRDPGVWTDTEGQATIIVTGDRSAVRCDAGGTFDIHKVIRGGSVPDDERSPSFWRLWVQADGAADAWELSSGSAIKIAPGWTMTEHRACVSHRGRRWSCLVREHGIGRSVRWSVRVHHGDVHDEPHLTNTVADAIVYIQCSRPIGTENSLPRGGTAAGATGRDGKWYQVLVAHCPEERMALHRSATVTARGGGGREYDEGMVFALVGGLPLGVAPAPRIIAKREQVPVLLHRQQTKRELAQAPWSGTTGDGDQPGFGAATCGGLWDPRANPHELRLWLEAAHYACVRPTLHTSNGVPIDDTPHDLLVLDLKPNWNSPNQLGGGTDPTGEWTRLPTPSDDEHRDDATLCIMAMATGDELLHERIRAHGMLQEASLWLRNEWMPTARGLGRMLLALAYAHCAGHTWAAPIIERFVGIARHNYAPGRPIAPVDEAKYGWRWESGSKVLGWQPWQQNILAIGLAAAARCARTELLRAQCLDMAASCAGLVVRLGFRRDSEAAPFRHVYAISDSLIEPAEDVPQRFVPHSLDGLTGCIPTWQPWAGWPTVDIPDCERWDLASAMMLCRQESPIGERARQILAQYPPRSGTSDGQWLAVTPFAPGVAS